MLQDEELLNMFHGMQTVLYIICLYCVLFRITLIYLDNSSECQGILSTLSFDLNCFCIAEFDKSIKNYTKFDDWYLWVQMHKGTVSMPIFQSLEAFWPGLQVRAQIVSSRSG